MSTICFYQDKRHHADLAWFRKHLGIGYLSTRNDGITELRINGYAQCHRILTRLQPYIRFKRKQAQYHLKATALLQKKTARQLSKTDRRILGNCLIGIQKQNYSSGYKKTKEEIDRILGLTP